MKMPGIIILLFILLSGCREETPLQGEIKSAESPTFKLAESHLPVWNSAIKQLMELADAMPEDQYSFKPHDSLRTFAEQLIHVANTSGVIANLYMKNKAPSDPLQQQNVSGMTKEEVKTFVRSQLEATGKIFSTVSDREMMDTIRSITGNKMIRLQGMISVHDHLTNHKAKANLYIRLSGHKPPEYRYY